MMNSVNKILLSSTLLVAILQCNCFASNNNILADGELLTGSHEISNGESININGTIEINPDTADSSYSSISDTATWETYYKGTPIGLYNKGTMDFGSEDSGNNLEAGNLIIKDAGVVVNEGTLNFSPGTKLTATMASNDDAVKYPTLYNKRDGKIDFDGAEFDGVDKDKFIFDNEGTVTLSSPSTIKNISIKNKGILDISNIGTIATTTNVDINGGDIQFNDNLIKSSNDDFANIDSFGYNIKNVTLTVNNESKIIADQTADNSNLADDVYYKYLSIYKMFCDSGYAAGTSVVLKEKNNNGGFDETDKNSDSDKAKEIAFLFYNWKIEQGVKLDTDKFFDPCKLSSDVPGEVPAYNDAEGVASIFADPDAEIDFSNLSNAFDTTGADNNWIPELPTTINAKLVGSADTVVSISNPDQPNQAVTFNGDVSGFVGTIMIPTNVSQVNLVSGPVLLDMANGNTNKISLNIGDSTKGGNNFGTLKIKENLLIDNMTINQPITLESAETDNSKKTINIDGILTAQKKITISSGTKLII